VVLHEQDSRFGATHSTPETSILRFELMSFATNNFSSALDPNCSLRATGR